MDKFHAAMQQIHLQPFANSAGDKTKQIIRDIRLKLSLNLKLKPSLNCHIKTTQTCHQNWL